MADFNYRFSIIPAGAITDARLSPRALQVLCLLGRHINDAGWCSRSQVKMANELGCGRATVYDAVEVLLDAAWIERKANARGSRKPVEGEHPFSAYSYRVRLDRDDLPDRIKRETDVPEGAAIAAGGADQAAGGAAIPAPLEGISSEGISLEPERESRAREEMPVAKFLKRWPTAAVDDHAKITKFWQSLTAIEQQAALDGIDGFLDRLKTEGRKHIIAGWKYLEEKRWSLLTKDEAAAPAGKIEIHTWSREWWAELFHRIKTGQSTGFIVRYALERSDKRVWYGDSSMGEADVLNAYAANGPEMAAWRPWFASRHIRFPEWEGRFSVFLPAPTPDGLATDEDLRQFAQAG